MQSVREVAYSPAELGIQLAEGEKVIGCKVVGQMIEVEIQTPDSAEEPDDSDSE